MEIDALKESLSQYESQLSQVNLALSVTPNGEEYDSLSSLRVDLLELINLTTETIKRLDGNQINDIKPIETKNDELRNDKSDNPLDDEYALFMAEMSKSGAYDNEEPDVKDEIISKESETENVVNNVDIEEELSSLEGMRCAVLFCHKLGGAPSLYNAMVSSVIRDNIDNDFHNIQVRVMFTNPTHIEMVPCPYYLNGECKFSDEICRFSHGEVVALSTLKEAIEPEFSLLKPGFRVLAKINQDEEATSSKSSDKYLLWHRAIVTSVAQEKHTCHVRLEHDILLKGNSKNDYKIDFGYIFPLTDDYSDSDDDSDSSNDTLYRPICINDDVSDNYKKDMVDKSLLNNPGSVMLGDWEKHTKGMGSKIMMKMGYITGTGLGPQGDGIIQPIPCQITPSGRSLDHCMDLREMTNLEDPIKAEKKLRRLKKKKEEQEKKASERAELRQQHNVFNFLNKTLSLKSPAVALNDGDASVKDKSSKTAKDIKTSTCKNLNIEQFKLAEDIKKLEKDVTKLKGSLLRNSSDSDVKRGISVQLNSKLNDIDNLKSRQAKISNEQTARKDKKKLSIF